MGNITAAMIKDLREKTGAGMLDCKKALEAAGGDAQKAIDEMRKKGVIKAASKSGRVAAEGVIAIGRGEGRAAMVEMNIETDFAAKNPDFLACAQKLADYACKEGIGDADTLKEAVIDGQKVADTLTGLVTVIGENVQLRRVMLLKAEAGQTVGSYLHFNRRIGVLALLKGGDEALGGDVCMHICAFKPEFVHPEDVSAEVVERERKIQTELAVKSGKPQNIAEKMVAGRMHKFTAEVSLTGQNFFKDESMTVGDLLKKAGADVVSFVRFEVGEGMEKKEDNFVAEVQAQMAAAQQG